MDISDIPFDRIEQRAVQHTCHDGDYSTTHYFFRLGEIWRKISIKVRRFQPVTQFNRKTVFDVTEEDIIRYLKSKCYTDDRISESMSRAIFS